MAMHAKDIKMNYNASPRTITTVSFIEGSPITRTTRFETPEEVEQRIKDEETEVYREQDRRQNTETLNCDACGEYICEVYACDLNGSRFYHNHCIQ